MLAFGALVANVCFRSWPRRIAFIAVCDRRADPRQRRPRLGHDLHRRTGPAASTSPRASTMSSMAASSSRSSSRLILGARLALLRPRRRRSLVRSRSAAARAAARRRACTLVAAAILAPRRAAAGLVERDRRRRRPRRSRRYRPARDAGWQRVAAGAGRAWQPHFAGADLHRASPIIATAQGRAVDLAIIVFARQSEGRELVGFGQGAVAPDGAWAWTADARRTAGRTRGTDRLARGGARGRQLLPRRRDRDRERGGGEAGDDEDAPARRPAARGRGAGLGGSAADVSAARRSTLSCARSGPVDRLADRAAGLRVSAMCGIAGIFHPDVPKPVDPARVEAMTDVLAHRGPDGSGVWTAPGVGLGHRRLSIIDLSDAAAQPMLGRRRPRSRSASTARSTISARCAPSSRPRAIVFRTESDTEVILAAWRQWGPDCLAAAQRHVRLRALRRRRRTRCSSPATGSA